MKLKGYYFLIFIQAISLHVFSQIRDLKFEHLSVEQGLSQGNVTCIHQDKLGFMWIGTEDGLNLYDGYNFTIFRNIQGDSTSLSDNGILCIAEDKQGHIWIGTQAGLNRYDYELNRFVRFMNASDKNSISNNNVNCIFFDFKDNLWAGTYNGLNLFDPVNKKFKRFLPDPNKTNSIPDASITSIAEDAMHRLWLGTMDGLSMFNSDGVSFTNYFSSSDPNTLSSSKIISLYPKGDELWIGTYDAGLNLMDTRKDGMFTRYLHKNDDPSTIAASSIHQMSMNARGELWITGDGGLSLMDRKKGTFTRFLNSPDDESSLSSNNVSQVYFDINDRMWVTTRFGGVNIYDEGNYLFNTIKVKGNNVTSFTEDEDGNIWIGVDGYGLTYYNRITGQSKNFLHDLNNKNSLSNNKVLALKIDYEGGLWIGYWGGGLDYYNRKTGKFRHYKHDPKNAKSLGDNNIFYLFEDRKKNLWIATWGNGLCKYNRATDDFTQYVHDARDPNSIASASIGYITEDHLGNLWLATDLGGLDMFNPKTKEFIHYKVIAKRGDISGNVIFSIYEDSKNRLWIGTNGTGLNLFDRRTKTFKTYRKLNGLPNEVIAGILEDDRGNLWLSTNNGLSKFNPEKEAFRNYDMNDGLQDNQFNRWAFLKLKTGELLFGGIKGFNLFNPDRITDNPFIPPIYITDFKLFNKSLDIGADEILKSNIILTKEISLSHSQNFFSFEFASLNYRHQKKNHYKYILEGLQNEWIDAGNERKVSYTNLNPGNYVFKVKTSNNDGIWNEEGASLNINIASPYWQTWWFITLLVLFIGGSVFLFIRIRTNSIQKQKKELERQVRERTEEVIHQKEDLQSQSEYLEAVNAELIHQREEILQKSEEAEMARAEAVQANQAKSVFLATMSHEIRTPMNGVIGMASLLAETSQTAEQQEYTETIKICGENLLTVINDILDFSKIESGKMELEQKDFDLRTCVEEVLDVFANKASNAGLDLVYEIDYNVPTKIISDSVRLRQVIMNLVSNAIKFTQQGEIFVGVHLLNAKGDQVEVGFEIRDTGIGIPPDKINRLFKAFSQVDSSTTRKYGGTGLGLVICEKLVDLMGGNISVESQIDQGTTFTFSIQANVSEESTRMYVHHNLAGLVGKKVLIVDDNLTNLNILKNQFTQWKLVPALASSGDQALAILSHVFDFDLVLSDMQMPDMDGLELARRIKKKHAALPIILLSSIGGDERTEEYNKLFTSVLTKPVRQAILFKHVVSQLSSQQPITEVVEATKKLSVDFSKKFPLNILIAEDNPVNQKLAERVLTKLGYKPNKAMNGQEVLAALDKDYYDVILMDVQMPVMDGLEATRKIRLSKNPQPAIIAMTANAMQGDREICIQAGMDDYISKPVKLEDLVDLLEKWALQIKA